MLAKIITQIECGFEYNMVILSEYYSLIDSGKFIWYSVNILTYFENR